MTNMLIDSGQFQNMEYLMYGLAAAAVLGWGLFMFMITLSPVSWKLFWVKVTKKDMLLPLRENRSMVVKPVKYNTGSADAGKMGSFLYNTDAMFRFNGINTALCFDTIAFPPSPTMIRSSHNLILNGIENILAAEGKIEDVMLKGMVKQAMLKEIPITLEGLAEANYPADIAQRMVSFEATMQPEFNANKVKEMMYLVDIFAIKRFFQNDATPTKINVIVEREKKDLLSEVVALMRGKIINFNNVMLFGMMLIMAAIAYLIIQSGTGQQTVANIAQQAGNMTQTLKIT